MNSSAMTSPTTSTRRLEKPSTSASRRSRRSASPGSGWTLRAINIADCGLRIADSLAIGAQDPARGGCEVVDDRVGGDTGHRPPLLGRAASRPDEDRARANRPRELHIGPLVADDERAGGMEAQVGRRAIDQPARRLAAV